MWLAGFALVLALGACSSPQPSNHVATMETTGKTGGAATPTVSSADPAASRPRERLDMTAEESDSLYDAYNQCLADHGDGVAARKVSGSTPSAQAAPPLDPKKQAAAEAACLVKKPLPPWEYDTSNPESEDFVHAVVQCLRGKGVRYVEEAPAQPGDDRRAIAFGGKDNDRDSITKGLNFISACEKANANGGHK